MTIDKLSGIYCSLGDEEKVALYRWCQDNDYSLSAALTILVRKQLIEKQQVATIATDTIEKKLANLQKTIDKLAVRVEAGRIRDLTDEDIAAIVKQPAEKVYLWRTGYQKPRGKRILEKLRPFEVVDGRWQLRNRIADSKNV